MRFLEVVFAILLYSLIAAAAPPPAQEVPPRNLNEATIAEAQIKDDDLKQAVEWMDKAEQKKAEKTIAPADSTVHATTSVETATVEGSGSPIIQKAEANLKEEEIPVLATTDATRKVKKEAPLARVVMSLGILLGMMAGVWLFYKKWARKGREANKNTRIKVLTQHYLGPRKSLAIIRVAGESILIGVTEQNITMIKSLALLDEDIPTEAPTQFSKSLEKAESKQNEEPEDEFSLTKIKDFVSGRLKGMKEI